MNVNLTAELNDLVRRKVASGLYNSASEVVRAALRLMAEQDRLTTIREEEFRKAVAQGISDMDEGRFLDVPDETAAIRLQEDIKARGRKRRARQPGHQA